MYKPRSYSQGVNNTFWGDVETMNPDTIPSVFKEAQEAMGARRVVVSPVVVKRDHLGVQALEVNFKEDYLKKDEKVYGKAKRCAISSKFSVVL